MKRGGLCFSLFSFCHLRDSAGRALIPLQYVLCPPPTTRDAEPACLAFDLSLLLCLIVLRDPFFFLRSFGPPSRRLD